MAEQPKIKANNGWLIAFRKYHTWLGLATTAFIVVIALTGIYLNHKDLFKGWGSKPKPEATAQHNNDTAHDAAKLTTATDLESLPVSFSSALALCREHAGDQPVERIELKNEHGRLVYKIKAASGELVIDAESGQASQNAKPTGKGQKHGGKEGPVVQTAAQYEKEQKGGMDWGKWLKDLHTGKIGGLAGKLLVDLTAVILVVLCFSGVYLYVVPALRKRRSAQMRGTSFAKSFPEAKPKAQVDTQVAVAPRS
jgi:hypothetical protein